jgi:Nif-specific regulatory protein
MPHVLVADDEEAIRTLLQEFLRGEGFTTSEAANGQQVQAALAEGGIDLVLMDVRMPVKTGLDVLREARDTRSNGTGHDGLPIIVMTAYSTATHAIEAIQLGAYDYIAKPFDLDHVLVTVNNFFKRQELANQVQALRAQLGERDPKEQIVGTTPGMLEVFKTIGRVARSDVNVLITGETGSGKESVAEMIHKNSLYSRGPLVKVNCAALPETLLESELFGHEKGSFTGAIAQHKGRFEQAHKGTIFLDEVGEMSLGTQKKLLRVLQEREFERVGGTETLKANVRLIAATNKDLETAIAEKAFREDLYYRLNVFTLFIPPLRERKSDLLLLADHFVAKYSREHGKNIRRISTPAIDMLVSYHWPGNVRELENIIERSVLVCDGNAIHGHHLPPTLQTAEASETVTSTSLTDAVEQFEKDLIADALKTTRGNRAKAARLLRTTERIVNYKVSKYEIDCTRFRG